MKKTYITATNDLFIVCEKYDEINYKAIMLVYMVDLDACNPSELDEAESLEDLENFTQNKFNLGDPILRMELTKD